MVVRTLVLLGALVLANVPAQAECDHAGRDSESYAMALRRLESVPAVMDWRDQVTESGATAAFLPPANWQIEVEGRCYWSIGLYSDEGTHFHLWDNYLVGEDGVVLKEVEEDEPLAQR